MITIEKYRRSMREDVDTLVASCKQGVLPSKLGGHALVARRDKKVVGFAWALTGDSGAAYIDYFCVDEKNRHNGIGLTLMTKMIVDLGAFGVEKVFGVVRDTGPTSVARAYKQVGMDVEAGFVLKGNIDTIKRKLFGRA